MFLFEEIVGLCGIETRSTFWINDMKKKTRFISRRSVQPSASGTGGKEENLVCHGHCSYSQDLPGSCTSKLKNVKVIFFLLLLIIFYRVAACGELSLLLRNHHIKDCPLPNRFSAQPNGI